MRWCVLGSPSTKSQIIHKNSCKNVLKLYSNTTMKNWRRNLFWTWSSLFLAMAGYAFAYPVLPYFLEDGYHIYDASKRDFYIAMFAFAGNFGFLLFSPLWGKLADVFGRKMMMTRANFCSGLLLPLIAFMPNPVSLVILRFFIGAFAGVVSSAMTLVASFTPNNKRGMALGAVSSAIFSGNLAGMVAGGFCVSWFGYTPTFLLCGVMMMLATAISHFLVKEDMLPKAQRPKADFRPQWKIPALGNVWFVLLITMFMGCVQMLDAPFVPVLVKMVLNGTNAEAMQWNGILGGACAAAGSIGGVALGWLLDRYPGHKVGIIISIIAAVFLLPQSWCSSYSLLVAERMVTTFFLAGFSPLMQTWLSLTTDSARRGYFFGLATSSRAVGWLLGGAIGAVVTYFAGTRAIFAYGGAALGVMALLILLTQYKIPFPYLYKKSQ